VLNAKHSSMSFVATVGEKCRVCFTCVRDCPAKAIRIRSGQAQIVDQRCIACGNCVSVCRQGAKQASDGLQPVQRMLEDEHPVAAIIAPSFPATFPDWQANQLIARLRTAGFARVSEVAFAADLVAHAYRKLLQDEPDKTWIATTCPAVTTYVEKYVPRAVDNLAPIASPMVVAARSLRALYGDDLRVVFIGPCIAKKAEAMSSGEVDGVLTFAELQELMNFTEANPNVANQFDPPMPGKGMLFPISKGLLQAAAIDEDLLTSEVINADGKDNFIAAIEEFAGQGLETKLLDVLCCNGCIMGPGAATDIPPYRRRQLVSRYARERLAAFENSVPIAEFDTALTKVNMTAEFSSQDQRIPAPEANEIQSVLQEMGKYESSDELDCGACGYATCREHAIAIIKGLAENEMCLPYTIERLKTSLSDLNESNSQLADVRKALNNAEKLASMGQLSAGIAHEINNPLGVILLYAKMSAEELPGDSQYREDLEIIIEQAQRCKTIVSGLLDFARQNEVHLRRTDLHQLLERCLQTLPIPAEIEVEMKFAPQGGNLVADADQLVQVLTNLIMNAVEAMDGSGRLGVSTHWKNELIELAISDNGCGISPDVQRKIFEPLFTTKPNGKGTGLGLAVSYGIVKMHKGQIKIESQHDPQVGPTGTTFRVQLPGQLAN
jgi:two-component system NtrC family sensor kinase